MGYKARRSGWGSVWTGILLPYLIDKGLDKWKEHLKKRTVNKEKKEEKV
ncbi:MAG: hypothetical protein ACUZ8O_08000 [Candidatus Anammoxibacter sp.]